MMRGHLGAALFVVVAAAAGGSSAATAGGAWPAFTRSPTAVRTGERVRIDFAVNRETDVAVFVEDAKGQVVRHLVAGVLGKDPPPPLRPGSLEQSIEWDGLADYGKPAGDGPFRVRVALGLEARYETEAIRTQGIGGAVAALAVGPSGTLYVKTYQNSFSGHWSYSRIVILNREGTYQRTILPVPGSAKQDDFQALGIATAVVDGRPVPLFDNLPAWKETTHDFFGYSIPRKSGMAVARDGTALFPAENHLCAIGPDGRGRYGKHVGPPMIEGERPGVSGRPFVCVSSDGRWAYVTGLITQPVDKATRNRVTVPKTAVYRVRLPERTPAEPFLGVPDKTGTGPALLGGPPRGVAVDGKGNLYVCDPANSRVVVVSERDGKYVGEFQVERPDGLGVDPKTGAVYVQQMTGGGAVEVVKFKSWTAPEVLARLPVRGSGNSAFPWLMAVDGTADPVVIWMGSDAGAILRIEDQGDRMVSRPLPGGDEGGTFLDLSVDRFRTDAEVYARGTRDWYYRYSETTGEVERVLHAENAGFRSGGGGGPQILAGPDGCLYALLYSHHMFKLDRNAKPVGFTEGGYPQTAMDKTGAMVDLRPGPKGSMYVPVQMTEVKHTLGIRHDGHIFVFQPRHYGGRSPKALHEYLPTGRQVTTDPIIWKVSDAAVGPKFDPQGNIYIAEALKPAGETVPPEFSALMAAAKDPKAEADAHERALLTMYGSILKFTPKGGLVHWEGENPYEGEPKLDPSLRTVTAGYYDAGHRRMAPLKVTGAAWIRSGMSHIELIYCICETSRFDVDEFGRVWIPDACRFRVNVLDTNGNDLTHFGAYGNADNRGPDSRYPGLGDPPIAVGWITGVAATDRCAYVGDLLNQRLLRCRLTYAAEEACEVR